jgi:hypothetical protein
MAINKAHLELTVFGCPAWPPWRPVSEDAAPHPPQPAVRTVRSESTPGCINNTLCLKNTHPSRELYFRYPYKGTVRPDWISLRAAQNFEVFSNKKNEIKTLKTYSG